MAHRRIGQVLVDMGFINDEQQELLVDEQHQHQGQLLGKVAVDMGLINEEQLAQALAEQMSLQTVSVADLTISKEVAGHGHDADGPDVSNHSGRVRRRNAHGGDV